MDKKSSISLFVFITNVQRIFGLPKTQKESLDGTSERGDLRMDQNSSIWLFVFITNLQHIFGLPQNQFFGGIELASVGRFDCKNTIF